ncbi:tRNA-dihydrouridine synthase 3 [Tulasnella sp. 427]|nr:tRNA-dihydrouridine synthase 3 [Tulasnella sp. 427]
MSASTSGAGPLPAAPLGTARVKPEFLIGSSNTPVAPAVDDDEAEGAVTTQNDHKRQLQAATGQGEEEAEPAAKKPKLSGAQRKKQAREDKKKNKGMNTNRKFTRTHDEIQLCWKIANGERCPEGSKCRFSHDIPGYLASKPRDIYFPSASALSSASPFISLPEQVTSENDLPPSVDSSTTCPIFAETGFCRQGFKCRFLGGHISVQSSTEGPHGGEGDTADGTGLLLVVDEEKRKLTEEKTAEGNIMPMNRIKEIRSRKYPTPITDAYLAELSQQSEQLDAPEEAEEEPTVPPPTSSVAAKQPASPFEDSPDTPMRSNEKKQLRWKGLTYLAPLTTVGNLVAGHKPSILGPIAEVLKTELGPSGRGLGALGAGNGLNFVDVNCGCPIDLVFKSGSGSALLDAPNRLGKILIGMNRALGEIPLTIKVRTGVKDGRNTAHKLMPKLDSWGVSAVTIHGRTRQQRYTRLADWSYIKQCVNALRNATVNDDDDMPSIPIFGGGDVYTAEGYWQNLENSGVDGIMIARGALIKPWLFTEIKERREWDISSRERLDILRKYAEYGLSHWGSDTQGVNTTRRFFCEALSFQSRYVPLGILESLPRINDRPPAFKGRDELETLLASGNSQDWVKLSEMFLGPAPAEWHFTPKHKSNAYSDDAGNG